MKTEALFLVLVLFAMVTTTALQATDLSGDGTPDPDREFMLNRVTLVKSNMLVESVASRYNTRYFAVRGNGAEVRLSELALEMNNPVLAEQLSWSARYNNLMAGVIISSVITAALDVIGASMLLSSYIMTNNGDSPQIVINNLTTSGIVLLSISSISIAGIISFGIFAARAFRSYYTFSQAQLFVNQYNKFLRKKLGIPVSLDIGYEIPRSEVSMSVQFRL
jgi:hypothetical protein